MVEVTAYAMSKMLSQLTGRKVSFAAVTKVPPSSVPSVYGTFMELPENEIIIVKADLGLLGSLAGCLLGMSRQIVQEHCLKLPLDEMMKDGIHEVLNVISAPLANENRVLLKAMYTDDNFFDAKQKQVLKTPRSKYIFNVLVDSYAGGTLSIFYKS